MLRYAMLRYATPAGRGGPRSASDETSGVLELLHAPGALVRVREAVPEADLDAPVLGAEAR